MKLPFFWVDAFADRLFEGNPAAVCVAEEWPETSLMQAIAAENNLSETAFILRAGRDWSIRWLTPVTEVDICGHATLASAWVIHNLLEPGAGTVSFASRSGVLGARIDGDEVVLDFPARPPQPADSRDALGDALGAEVVSAWVADYHLAELASEEAVRQVTPDPGRVAALGKTGVIVTAAGSRTDFVCRFFAPAAGVPEDPVTGSAYCTLAPFWAGRLQRHELSAMQLSARGGRVRCGYRGSRVDIGGSARLYLRGTIDLTAFRG